MTRKKTNFCKLWRSCSSRRKGAALRCRAKNLAAPAKRFVDRDLRNKWPDKKNLLAMAINSNMNAGGASRGSISRNYERYRDAFACPVFGRLFRLALRGDGLLFQRVRGECSVYSQ